MQLSLMVSVYVPAGRLLTDAVVPTETLLLLTQLYETLPTALETIPADTEPVDVPLQAAST